jgi:hypothetical protein
MHQLFRIVVADIVDLRRRICGSRVIGGHQADEIGGARDQNRLIPHPVPKVCFARSVLDLSPAAPL